VPLPDPLDQLRAALPSGWHIERTIRGGGQGVVCLGKLNGEQVAIKVFSLATDTRRIDRELDCLTGIDCPHLVKVKGRTNINIAGVSAAVVAYEYLPGGDLRQRLISSPIQPQERAILDIGMQIGIAVQELWRKRIVHRDIKPDNIVLASEDRYVLVDLGIARLLDRSNLTGPWAIPGTPGYMSPEQARGRRDLTIHSDVFSLGITLYELASRTHPFGSDQNRIGAQNASPLGGLRPDLSEPLVRTIQQMMEVIPGRRPNDPAERFQRLRGT
jgi:eukaryotic-like serine/threonine-protein kinase